MMWGKGVEGVDDDQVILYSYGDGEVVPALHHVKQGAGYPGDHREGQHCAKQGVWQVTGCLGGEGAGKVAAAEGRDLVNPNKKRKKDSEHKKKRPANSFGQFLKHKRATEAKVDFKKARGEWGEMSDNNKEYYKNLFEEEKSKLCGQNSKSVVEKMMVEMLLKLLKI